MSDDYQLNKDARMVLGVMALAQSRDSAQTEDVAVAAVVEQWRRCSGGEQLCAEHVTVLHTIWVVGQKPDLGCTIFVEGVVDQLFGIDRKRFLLAVAKLSDLGLVAVHRLCPPGAPQ